MSEVEHYERVSKFTHNKVNVLAPYLPLVKRLAKRLADKLPSHIQFQDLSQAGVIGLMEALTRFDASLGTTVEQYACTRIRGAMLDFVRSQEWLPRAAQKNIKKIKAAIMCIEQETGRHAQDHEVAEKLNMPLTEYHQNLQAMAASEVFHYAKETEDLDTFLNQSEPDLDAQVEQAQLKDTLSKHLKQLPEKEQLVLSFYYKEELTFQEIGDILKVSESRICQLHRQALLRLHTYFEEQPTPLGAV